MKYSFTHIYDPEGNLVWSGPYGQRSVALVLISETRQNLTLKRLLAASQIGVKRIDSAKVLRTAVELGFVDTNGTPIGFLNTLPRGAYLNECLSAYDRNFYLPRIKSHRVDFPLVFDSSQADMAALIHGFEKQGSLFAISKDLRLSYAADTGFFPWLRGRKVDSVKTPYTVYSPTNYMRKGKSGELNGLNRVHQFGFPDLHTICTEENGLDRYTEMAAVAADGMRFFLNDDWAQFIDIEEKFLKRNPEIPSRLAREVKQWTVVHEFPIRPRYYSMRSGLVCDAGFGQIMLYNFQWDDTNAERFNIQFVDRGDNPVVIHSTLMGGISRLLPVLISRGLIGDTLKIIPAELSRWQLSLIPTSVGEIQAATEIGECLRQNGIAAKVIKPEFSLRKKIGLVIQNWDQYYAVIGKKEASGDEVFVQSRPGLPAQNLSSWMEQIKLKLTLCQKDIVPWEVDLPFPENS
jgi:threonyl-tRNA synthetase